MSMEGVSEMGSGSIPVSYLTLLPSPLPAKSGNERWRHEKMGISNTGRKDVEKKNAREKELGESRGLLFWGEGTRAMGIEKLREKISGPSVTERKTGSGPAPEARA